MRSCLSANAVAEVSKYPKSKASSTAAACFLRVVRASLGRHHASARALVGDSGRWSGGQSSALRSSAHHPSVPAAPCVVLAAVVTPSLWAIAQPVAPSSVRSGVGGAGRPIVRLRRFLMRCPTTACA